MIRHDWELPALGAIVAWVLYGWLGVLIAGLVTGSWLVGIWSVTRTWRALKADQASQILSWTRR